MAKKIVQDVLPPERRTIRDIPLPGDKPRRKETPRTPEVVPPAPPSPPRPRRASFEPVEKSQEPKRNYTRITLWTAAAICVVALLYAGSFLFAGATVGVTPKQQTVPVDMAINAQKDAPSGAPSYTLISISKEESKEVKASGDQKVEKKASGKIVIYNNYSSASQALVKNTRFESPDGLIFRINEAVTVPGKTIKNGVSTPGSVKVVVFADQPGEKYNIGLADFTIPGFKGDAKYTAITAKSDPAAKIEGGFIGVEKKVSEADALVAKNSIETSLRSALIALARAEAPSTHILYDDLVQYSFESLPQESTSAGSATIKEKGTIYGILFDRAELAKIISEKTLLRAEGEALPLVYAKNLEELAVVFKNKSTFNPKNSDTATVSLKGSLNLVWDIENNAADLKALKEALAGKRKGQIQTILLNFGSIEKAQIVVRPFWSFSFPKKAEKIRIKVLKP